MAGAKGLPYHRQADMISKPKTTAERRPVRGALGRSLAALAGLALCTTAGCAKEDEEVTRRLEQLQAEIRDLRGASLAAQDRLETVDRELEALRKQAEAAAPAAEGGSERPALPVVRVVPDSTEPSVAEGTGTEAVPTADGTSGLATDDAPRPLLLGDKKGASIQPGTTATAKPSKGAKSAPAAAGPAGARTN